MNNGGGGDDDDDDDLLHPDDFLYLRGRRVQRRGTPPPTTFTPTCYPILLSLQVIGLILVHVLPGWGGVVLVALAVGLLLVLVLLSLKCSVLLFCLVLVCAFGLMYCPRNPSTERLGGYRSTLLTLFFVGIHSTES